MRCAASLVVASLVVVFVVACEPEAAPADAAGVLLVDGAACDVEEVITDAANPIFHSLSLSTGPLETSQVVLRIVEPSRAGVQVVPSDNGDATVRFGLLVSRGTPATATLRLEHGNPDVPVCDRPLRYVVD